MTLQNTGLFTIPEFWMHPHIGSVFTLNATGERIAVVIQIAKAGNIRNVWFRTTTVTEEDVLKISLQGVNSSGVPDGTILGAGNNGFTTATFTDADDAVWLGPYQLGVDVAVVRGQTISVVMEWNAYSDGNLTISNTNASSAPYNQYGVTDTTATPGTWLRGTLYMPCISLEYDDGTYVENYGGGYAAAHANMNTGTTPDEVGNYTTFPFSFEAVGIWLYGDFDYDVTLSLQLSDGTVLANCVLEADYRMAANFGCHHNFFDSNPASAVTIAAGTAYRVVISPTVATSVVPRVITVPEAAGMGAFPLGTACVYTSRVDAGAWSQTATERLLIGLIGDKIDVGTEDYPDVGNVTEDDTTNGAAGTYHEATVAEVQDGVMFGASSALEGTYKVQDVFGIVT